MRKTYSLFTACAVLLLLGCTAPAACQVGEKSKLALWEEGDIADITFTVVEGTLSKTGGTFCLRNSGGLPVTYGTDFSIEIRYQDHAESQWNRLDVNFDAAFTAEELTIFPGEEKLLTVDWDYLYGSLPVGEYRLAKEILVYIAADDAKLADSLPYESWWHGDNEAQHLVCKAYIAAEFAIE